MKKFLKGLIQSIREHPIQSLYLIWLLIAMIASYIGGMVYCGAVEGKTYIERKVNDISSDWQRNRKA